MEKIEFIQNEIWLTTVSAAFQRANVYKPNIANKEKDFLKNKIRGLLDMSILQDYNNQVSDEQHIQNIYSIKELSECFSNILNNESLSFGVCQKILNLYLKFQWCLGLIKSTPPHFPVDRRIQEYLNISNIVSWTTKMGEKEYMNIIGIARNKLKEYDKENIAELELTLFERRSNS